MKNKKTVFYKFPIDYIWRLFLPFYLSTILLVVFSYLIVNVSQAEVIPKRRILILNSYHKGFKWTDSQTSAAIQVLNKKIDNLEIYVEYMDTKRIYNSSYIDHLSHIFKEKYSKLNFDAIITTDDNALKFAKDYHHEIFGGTPVAFCGINNYNSFHFKKGEKFTGLVEVLDIKLTIDLALRIHPEVKRVYVVVDNTTTGKGQLKDVRAVAPEYNDLEFIYLKGTDYSNDELLNKLRSLPEDSIVLLTVWLQDKNKTYLSAETGGSLISSNSSVPVYGIIDMYFGQGIVGGKLLNSSSHGRTAAEMAVRISNGEKPESIPVIFDSTNPYMFDYTQLKRWDIDISKLPANKTIINRPFSVYEENKKLIWSTVIVFMALVLFVLLLAANIMKRRQTENALKESEKKYKSLFDNMLNGLALHQIVLDKDNQPVDYIYNEINASFEKLTGLDKDTTIGKRVTEVIPNIREDKTNWIDIYGKVALEGKNIAVEEYSEPLNRWYNISAYSPKKGYFATVIEEITERKKAEMEREVLIKDLELKNAELERFTYTVSHDLKSPIITIKGFLGMLEKDADEGNRDRMKSDINRISKAADKMQIMLDELLTLSRIGRIDNPPISKLFKDLAQKAVDTVAGRLRKKDVKIEIGKTPVEIKGDIPRLLEVMENLLDNAAKFSGNQEQTKIVIGTRQDATETIYYVKDNGIGIKPQYHDKVFGLFDKLDQNAEGTGIGLAIVKRVIEVHKGRIWVESEGEDKGTTICFTVGETFSENI